MAKKEKVNKKLVDYNSGIEDVNISEVCTEYMKIFGANTNIMRHLPAVYDGLKIGERRILYTMYIEKHTYDKPFKKLASITGKVLDFHPHGDIPVNDTTVKLAQPWNNIQCLVDRYGNFGSAAGDPAGAPRYIEARLSFYAHKCFFEEFSPEIVDMKLNYSGDKLEPEYLPSRYPNVLINNTFGIGYGLSTSICTYNLKEVIELTLKLIDDPAYEDITLIPDSPTGAYIVDEGQFPEISRTGKGKFKMRGVIEIDEVNNCLIIRSTPLQAFWINIKKSIFNLLNDGKNNMMVRFSDDSEGDDMCYRIYLKKEIDPVAIKQLIYSKTQMEKTFPVNFKLIEDYEDTDYNIRSILLTWINFRRETKRSYYNHQLKRATERQHILNTLLFILNKDNAERTMTIMKKSENKKDIISKLMKAYGISSLQADTIAEMKGHQYSKEALKRYKQEKEEIDKKVDELNKMVRSSKKIDKVIKDELKEGIKLFGEERRSQIITIDNEVKVRDTDHVLVFTRQGFVKKLPSDVKNIGFINNKDYPIEIIETNNTSELLIFDERGTISKLPVYNVHGTVLNNEGEKLSNHCSISGGIVAIKARPTAEVLDKISDDVYFLMVTQNGIIKKTLASAYTNIRNELLGMIIKDNDKLVCVKLLVGDKDVLLYTDKGYGVRFNSANIKETSRMSIGVKGIDLSDHEYVIGMDIVNENDKYLFALTNKGFGKKCTLNTFRTMDRNSKPLRIISLDDEQVTLIKTIKGNETFKVYMKNGMEMIDMNDVLELPRLSKGKKLVKVPKGETIIDIKEKY